jgi:hypothetical protein
VVIYPNIVSQNSIVIYRIGGVEFDNIKIIDLTEQTIAYKVVVNKANLYFNAPNMAGIYFVQL